MSLLTVFLNYTCKPLGGFTVHKYKYKLVVLDLSAAFTLSQLLSQSHSNTTRCYNRRIGATFAMSAKYTPVSHRHRGLYLLRVCDADFSLSSQNLDDDFLY